MNTGTINKKYNLSFISDNDIEDHTLNTVRQFRTGMSLSEFRKNIIDPIKLTFDAHVYKRSISDVIDAEVIRQLNKSNENLIGYFHQNIFKYVGEDWKVPTTGEDGWDVENHDKSIYAEIKNKHNTMNSGAAAYTHGRMRELIEGNSRATCYLVEIIAKRSQDIPWKLAKFNLRTDRQERLRRISIDKFYEIVTGDKKSFASLCSVIGSVIDNVLKANPQALGKNTVLEELGKENPDILKTIFLSSFVTYQGFNEFEIR